LYDTKIQQIQYIPYTPKLIQTLQIIEAPNIKYPYKYANREQFEQLTNQTKCDDVIIAQNGYITDTTIANIALLKGDVWYTPASTLLNGTTREFLLDNHMLCIKDIKVDDIFSFDKIALMNAMIRFYHIDKPLKDIICK
jgi:4-amino-4-deoxychorismate lyase